MDLVKQVALTSDSDLRLGLSSALNARSAAAQLLDILEMLLEVAV